MIYLDTHVVVWLYEGLVDNFSVLAKNCLEKNELMISPMVELELQYLFEIKKINQKPKNILAELEQTIGLKVCAQPLATLVTTASTIHWTRDPFDRLIVAAAKNQKTILLTKDRVIKQHYEKALW